VGREKGASRFRRGGLFFEEANGKEQKNLGGRLILGKRRRTGRAPQARKGWGIIYGATAR